MSNDGTASNNPFNRWWIVSALFVVAVAVAVVLVLVLGRGQDDAAAPVAEPPMTSGSAQPSTSESPVAGAGKCDVNTANQDIPTAGPQAEWETERYLFFPTSPEYGPIESDGLWGCFAPSPTGALFAAANAVANVGREDFPKYVNANAVDNGGGEQFIATTQARNRGQSPGRVAQIAGFTFASVQPEKVTVQVIFAQGEIEASSTASLVWDSERSTWLVDYAASSMLPTEFNGALYTPWSASE